MTIRTFVLGLLLSTGLHAQTLKPGFDPEEYRQMLLVLTRMIENPDFQARFPAPTGYTKIYRSQEVGLSNLWELWIDGEHRTAIIAIRGTSPTADSWLLNFYAAMIPAKGVIRWGPDSAKTELPYQVSEHPSAAIHAGWMVGTATLYHDMQPKLDSLYETGVRDYYIVGHSQGGGIAYLLTAFLRQGQKNAQQPPDIRWKTYCSAAPKPGNLPFAYSYEAMTQNGWAFNVVNASDWVPEVPFSVQTLDDFNPTNPFVKVDEILDQQSFPRRVVLKHIYKKLDKPTRKAQKNFEKFLGEMTEKMVEENMPGLEVPAYVHTNNYVRTGIQIVMMPDEEYFKTYPDKDSANAFTHHGFEPYLYLVDQLEEPFYKDQTRHPLEGSWQLIDMPGEAVLPQDFMDAKLPVLRINMQDSTISGFGGCNNYSGSFRLASGRFIPGDILSTKRYCGEANREKDYFSALNGSFEYYLEDEILFLLEEDQIVLKFKPDPDQE